ncbi:hypothetical protein [Phenylobacterium sp.]|jgi:hypothetical protein|uniref:hypothetical protein n=1 Tax=Phenylobacterium sp. TaxID=1871053 RepID=UPI002E329E62|nr:hypothetical protein [Phenylobacterium sp.]HEX2560637.1 hypothetical protein [Phenylobacterium sp.]
MRPVILILAALPLVACQSGQKQFARESRVNAPVEAVVQSEPGRQAASEAAQQGESASEAVEEAPPAAAASGTK